MFLRLYSDLHYGINTKTPFHIPNPVPGEVLILAGDIIDNYSKGIDFLKKAADADRTILFIPGNHEYHSRDILKDNSSILLEKINSPNFIILDNETITINGYKFIGSTLWSDLLDTLPYPELVKLCNSSGDFRAIHYNGKPITIDERQSLFDEAVIFLEREVTKDSIVITHYLPSISLIYKDYKDSPRIPLFASDLDYLILKKKPKLWLYGHTHFPNDTLIGDTRLISNPYGYINKGEGVNFNPYFIRVV